MPPENALQLHTLMTLHSAMTSFAFLGGPIMIWQAWKDKAGALYWTAALFPLAIEAQRFAAGDRCIVQDLARKLWQIDDPAVWAPDLYLVDQSWVTYVVDACIVSYAAGLIISVALFLRRRHGLGRPAINLPSPNQLKPAPTFSDEDNQHAGRHPAGAKTPGISS